MKWCVNVGKVLVHPQLTHYLRRELYSICLITVDTSTLDIGLLLLVSPILQLKSISMIAFQESRFVIIILCLLLGRRLLHLCGIFFSYL